MKKNMSWLLWTAASGLMAITNTSFSADTPLKATSETEKKASSGTAAEKGETKTPAQKKPAIIQDGKVILYHEDAKAEVEKLLGEYDGELPKESIEPLMEQIIVSYILKQSMDHALLQQSNAAPYKDNIDSDPLFQKGVNELRTKLLQMQLRKQWSVESPELKAAVKTLAADIMAKEKKVTILVMSVPKEQVEGIRRKIKATSPGNVRQEWTALSKTYDKSTGSKHEITVPKTVLLLQLQKSLKKPVKDVSLGEFFSFEDKDKQTTLIHIFKQESLSLEEAEIAAKEEAVKQHINKEQVKWFSQYNQKEKLQLLDKEGKPISVEDSMKKIQPPSPAE